MQAQVGSRVKIGDHFGTVRFRGLVGGSGGPEWLGVEWDDPSRGKHSGTHEGREYFRCKSSSPTAASFVKVEGRQRIECGVTIVEALKEKYSLSTADREGVVGRFGDTSVPVEMVGFSRVAATQTHFDRLEIVGLADMLIATAGDIGSMLPRIADIDLSRNLLSSWQDVAGICRCLPRLETLRLNYNRFSDLTHSADTSGFSRVSTLALQFTSLSWQEIVALCHPGFCVLQELYCGFNSISSLKLDLPVDAFSTLRVLNLESNSITSWEEVGGLSQLQSLESLVLTSNQLTTIAYKSGFLKLSTLAISGNLFVDMSSIAALSLFPALTDLKCSNLPLFKIPFDRNDALDDILRIILISVLPRVKIVNGSPVSRKERTDCEIFYVKLCNEERGRRSSAQMTVDFMRFRELLNEYELEEETEEQKQRKADANKLKGNLISVDFVSGDKTVTRALPASTDMRTIKSVAARFFKIPPNRQQIVLTSDGILLETNDILDARELRFYANTANGKVLINVSKR